MKWGVCAAHGNNHFLTTVLEMSPFVYWEVSYSELLVSIGSYLASWENEKSSIVCVYMYIYLYITM